MWFSYLLLNCFFTYASLGKFFDGFFTQKEGYLPGVDRDQAEDLAKRSCSLLYEALQQAYRGLSLEGREISRTI